MIVTPHVEVDLVNANVHLHDDAPPPALGEKVRYRPMHVCPVVNLTDALVGTRAGVVEEVFEVAARGRTW